MKIINLTPHPVIILIPREDPLVFESEGAVRLESQTFYDGTLNGIPMSRTRFGEPEGLPPFRENVFIIVSRLVKEALPDRWDLLTVNETVRDKNGKVVGCKSLSFF